MSDVPGVRRTMAFADQIRNEALKRVDERLRELQWVQDEVRALEALKERLSKAGPALILSVEEIREEAVEKADERLRELGENQGEIRDLVVLKQTLSAELLTSVADQAQSAADQVPEGPPWGTELEGPTRGTVPEGPTSGTAAPTPPPEPADAQVAQEPSPSDSEGSVGSNDAGRTAAESPTTKESGLFRRRK